MIISISNIYYYANLSERDHTKTLKFAVINLPITRHIFINTFDIHLYISSICNIYFFSYIFSHNIFVYIIFKYIVFDISSIVYYVFVYTIVEMQLQCVFIESFMHDMGNLPEIKLSQLILPSLILFFFNYTQIIFMISFEK